MVLAAVLLLFGAASGAICNSSLTESPSTPLDPTGIPLSIYHPDTNYKFE